MERDAARAAAADLFKVLGNESRLALVMLLQGEPRTVSSLVEETGLSQPLVSQHLRTLRDAGLVSGTRDGREVAYHLADHHVAHVVGDALIHVAESALPDSAAATRADPSQQPRSEGEKP